MTVYLKLCFLVVIFGVTSTGNSQVNNSFKLFYKELGSSYLYKENIGVNLSVGAGSQLEYRLGGSYSSNMTGMGAGIAYFQSYAFSYIKSRDYSGLELDIYCGVTLVGIGLKGSYYVSPLSNGFTLSPQVGVGLLSYLYASFSYDFFLKDISIYKNPSMYSLTCKFPVVSRLKGYMTAEPYN